MQSLGWTVVPECRDEDGRLRRCAECPHAIDTELLPTQHGIQRSIPRCSVIQKGAFDRAMGGGQK